jgi:hypothetical protein
VLSRWRRGRGKKTGRDRDGEEEGKTGFNRACARGERKKQRRQDKVEERRKTDRIPQGLIRNYRKLQGPVCKTKFSIDLKPK